MPRIFGLNIIAAVVATIALYLVGFVFYGVLFAEQWMALWDFSEAHIAYAESVAGPAMGIGFLVSLATGVFIGLAVERFAGPGIGGAVRLAVFLWAGFALTSLAYDHVYALQPVMLLVIDATHLLVGYIVAAVVYSLMRNVAVKA